MDPGLPTQFFPVQVGWLQDQLASEPCRPLAATERQWLDARHTERGQHGRGRLG
jgi:hypothetical protein